MKTFHSIESFTSDTPTVLTIGTFDGIHIGHKKILKRVVSTAKEKGLSAAVLTFFPHPRMVLQKESDIKLIHTINERIAVLKELGIDNLIVHPFSKEFSRLSALEFVRDVLVNQLQVKHIIIGYDHRFGRNRTANIEDLRDFGYTYGFTVEEISAQDIDQVAVSSTKIRNAILAGEIEKANDYMGYPFCFSGVVTRGKGLGRTINYPTANVEIAEPYKIVPKNGVYVARAFIGGKECYGMMNIGVNPTVNGQQRSIEIHIFNFKEDIYDTVIDVQLLMRLRDEQKYDSVALLKEQLQKDEQEALAYIKQL